MIRDRPTQLVGNNASNVPAAAGHHDQVKTSSTSSSMTQPLSQSMRSLYHYPNNKNETEEVYFRKLPDVRGMTVDEAKRTILDVIGEKEHNMIFEEVLEAMPHHAAMFTTDYNIHRIRLVLNKDAKTVAHIPRRG